VAVPIDGKISQQNLFSVINIFWINASFCPPYQSGWVSMLLLPTPNNWNVYCTNLISFYCSSLMCFNRFEATAAMKLFIQHTGSRYSSVSMVSRLRTGQQSSIPDRDREGNFSFYHHAQTASGVHSVFHSVGTGGYFRGNKAVRGVKLTTNLNLVPKLRMRGGVSPFLIRLLCVMFI
jgi:hypothetical protein